MTAVGNAYAGTATKERVLPKTTMAMARHSLPTATDMDGKQTIGDGGGGCDDEKLMDLALK